MGGTGAFGIGAAIAQHWANDQDEDTDSTKAHRPDRQLTTRKAVLAGSMTSAFAAAHAKQKSARMESNVQSIKRVTSQASNVTLLQQIHTEAHARDFTRKQWHKRTKNLTGADLFDALWPPVPDYPCEKPMKISSMNKLVSKIYEQLCSEFYAGAQRASRAGERARPPLVQYVEDSLLLQYGMPSLARK